MPNTKKRYVSDIIDDEEIAKWLPNQRVLIRAGTGSGKSYFVAHNLFEFAKQRKRRILWLSNRNLLKSQIIEQLDTSREEYIDVMNYQKLQEKIRRSSFDLAKVFSNYHYIVFDEAHYIFADSFNRKTDIILNLIRSSDINKVILLLTATPHQILTANEKYEYDYDQLKEEYDYIEDIYFYNNDDELNRIIKRIPENEKIIYFSNRIDRAVETYKNNPDSKFICSKSNQRYKKYISTGTLKEISELEFFSTHLLCTTRVLDNGVNIKDEAVKHIIVDLTHIVQIIQSVGRVRVLNPDYKINLYFRNRNKFQLQGYINRLEEPLKTVETLNRLGKEKFQDRFVYEDFHPIINNKFEKSEATELAIKYEIKMYESMIKLGFKKYICNQFYTDERFSKNAEQYFGRLEIEEILKEYEGKKLFSENRVTFRKLFMESAYSPKRRIYKKNSGINTINGLLSDMEINYVVISKTERAGENRDKVYWMVISNEIE